MHTDDKSWNVWDHLRTACGTRSPAGGMFITGNGVNDDHVADDWRSTTRTNGFATGIWAPSTSHAALVTALRSGRAYTAHAGKWARGQLDLMVDGTVPMGAVSVTTRTSRDIDIQAANLPAGSSVELIRGRVDYAGNDPGTWVVTRVAASTFGTTGIVRRAVSTTAEGFFRTQFATPAGSSWTPAIPCGCSPSLRRPAFHWPGRPDGPDRPNTLAAMREENL